MYPILFTIGSVVIYTYGFALTIGGLVSSFLIWRRGRKLLLNEESIIDMVLLSLVVSLIFSRVAYIFSHGAEFGGNVLKMIVVTYFPGFDGAFALIGGLLGCLLFALYKKWSLLSLFDCIVLGLSLGISIVMLGSFFAGNYVGAPSGSSYGVVVPGFNQLRHPVSLYYALYSFLLFLILIIIDKVRRKDGFLTGLFFVLFGLALVLFEWYTSRSLIMGIFSLNQLIGVVGIVIGSGLVYKLYFQKPRY
ncbi:MAG: prolipoprotein diacylglyceryl transferase [bacterium]|nr:prolipoprotein diacylglyceryl transferase [bacterium]